ncbi:hypothetical protein A2U01_0116070, partial [Trifolium medium]|nr:hypothetical protein [Trifolium medium]
MAKTIIHTRHYQCDKVVPDASTSLAQDQPQDEMIDDVVADSNVQQDKDIAD